MNKIIPRNKLMQEILKYMTLYIASIMNAVAIGLLIDPNHLAPGGLTGIAIIINYLIEIPTGTIILILNIPIMILGVWKLGIKFFISTIFVVITSSTFVNLFSEYKALTDDPLLAALGGGSLLALGMGIVFRNGATTGGIDIVIRIIKMKFNHIKTGRLFLMIDGVVVIFSAIIFKNITLGMYSAIAVVVSSYVLDYVLYGGDDAKLIYIISENDKEIANRLMEELDLGLSFINGEGGYSGKVRDIIMCVVRKQLYPKVQQIVNEEDKDAFVIVSSASEVFGEGYKGHEIMYL